MLKLKELIMVVAAIATILAAVGTWMGVRETRQWSCRNFHWLCDGDAGPTLSASSDRPLPRRVPEPSPNPPVPSSELPKPSSIGNSWISTRGNLNGDLVVRGDVVSTPHHSGRAGIYRSLGTTVPVTVSATITHENGYGGLLNRYDATFLFGNDGSIAGGYGIQFTRGDQNYSDSAVRLVLNGKELTSEPSKFQFGASVRSTLTLSPNGSISGSVMGEGNTWSFSFGPRSVTLPGPNFAIVLGFPDARSSVITNSTVRDIRIMHPEQTSTAQTR